MIKKRKICSEIPFFTHLTHKTIRGTIDLLGHKRKTVHTNVPRKGLMSAEDIGQSLVPFAVQLLHNVLNVQHLSLSSFS